MRVICLGVKMRRCEERCEDEKMICVDVEWRGCEYVKMICVNVKMRRCEHEKM